MFDSGISVKNLIEELKNTEVDIALDIPNATYVSWLNSLQQLLYTEVIKEQKEFSFFLPGMLPPEPDLPELAPDDGYAEEESTTFSLRNTGGGYWQPGGVGYIDKIELSEITTEENESQPRFEDIHAFYAGKTQLIKSTIASGSIFPNTFFKYENNIGYRYKGLNTDNARIIYFVKPALVKVDDNDNIVEVDDNGNIIDVNIMVPIEFIDLVKCKLRGEAYKLVNEDDIAAKWLNDYNILLETFKAWINEKSPNFGL